jgi:hypothetical protein
LPSGIQMLPLIVDAAGKGDTDIAVVDAVGLVDP